MEEGASPPRWALDKKLLEDVSMEEKKEGEKEKIVCSYNHVAVVPITWSIWRYVPKNIEQI